MFSLPINRAHAEERARHALTLDAGRDLGEGFWESWAERIAGEFPGAGVTWDPAAGFTAADGDRILMQSPYPAAIRAVLGAVAAFREYIETRA